MASALNNLGLFKKKKNNKHMKYYGLVQLGVPNNMLNMFAQHQM